MFVFVILTCLFLAALWSVTCLEMAGLLALLCVMFFLCFVTFPYGALGQVWIPDLSLLLFYIMLKVDIIQYNRNNNRI